MYNFRDISIFQVKCYTLYIPPTTSRSLIRPADIAPLPSCSFGSSNKKWRRGSAALITGSPYKLKLEESLIKNNKLKITLQSSSTKQNHSKKIKAKPKPKKRKQKKVQMSSSSSSEDVEVQLIDTDDDMDKEEEDAECLYCNNFFSEDSNGEKWIRCKKCFRWSHEECAGIDKKDTFVCEICLNG
ncbi:hypothetical protein ABEB36_003658 [Hypothenemus hampei]|uniref:Zinc finger PHD-type domain-containing protein n=1 Tax=Hypothenemus hampei TaxID=57062 RepID=A0ABD1F9Y1_HYPHA